MRENSDSGRTAMNLEIVWRRFCTRGWVYMLLLSGAIIFSLPFIWMVTTAVKLDREIFEDDLSFFPQPPVPALKSPYVDKRQFRKLEGDRLDEVLPALEKHLKSGSTVWPIELDRPIVITQVARGVFQKLSNTIPKERWKEPLPELKKLLFEKVDDEMVQRTLRTVERRLGFGPIRARSSDLREDVLVSGKDISNVWNIGGDGDGKFLQVDDSSGTTAHLHYDFSKGDTVTLTHTFSTSFPIEKLYRLQFSLEHDDSWHPLTVYIEKLGVKYRTVVPRYLADSGPSTLVVQEPGRDDKTNKIHSWTLLKEIARGDTFEKDPHKIKITLEIKRNSLWGAWRAKITRNYRLVFQAVPFGRYVATSIFLVILNITCTLFSCSLVAYSFARLQWPGRGFCFFLMLATMMIPHQVTMIPHFLVMKSLGLYNTLYPLWIGSLFAGAFNVFLLRQFFKGIPRDLEDAAKIDGCGFWRIYWHIMLPLVKPTLAAIAIFTFMHSWNDFMGPLIYLSDQRLYPLSFGLYALNVQSGGAVGGMGLMMAGSLLMTLPVIIIFFFSQKYFIQGITFSGMKG